MKYVVGIGELLFDCLPAGRQLGGAPCTFAFHVSQFGLNSCAISALGKDLLGDEIEEYFDRANVQHVFQRVDYPTGTVKVTLSKTGVPDFDICQGVAWDNIQYTEELAALAKNAEVVCFGTLAQRNSVSRETILKFLEETPEDSLRVFDCNLRKPWFSKEVFEESLEYSNVLKINDDELVALEQMLLARHFDSVEDSCKVLLEKYKLKMLVLTRGAKDSYVFAGESVSHLPTPKVDVADTVGAGDSFIATFIAQVFLGKSIQEAHRKAVDVSAYVCTQNGSMPILPRELLA